MSTEEAQSLAKLVATIMPANDIEVHAVKLSRALLAILPLANVAFRTHRIDAAGCDVCAAVRAAREKLEQL